MASMKCPNCGLVNFVDNGNCRRCGNALGADMYAQPPGGQDWPSAPPQQGYDQQQSWGGPPQQQGYDQQQSWGGPPQQQGYDQQQSWGGPPQQPGFGQQSWGGPPQQPGFGQQPWPAPPDQGQYGGGPSWGSGPPAGGPYAQQAPGTQGTVWGQQQQYGQPPFGQNAAAPPYGYASPGYANPEAEEAKKQARNSMIGGLVGLICFGFILGIYAIITGFKARSTLQQLGVQEGQGMALAGIILGFLDIAGWVLFMLGRFS